MDKKELFNRIVSVCVCTFAAECELHNNTYLIILKSYQK